MADRSSNVFLRLITEYKRAGVQQAGQDLREMRRQAEAMRQTLRQERLDLQRSAEALRHRTRIMEGQGGAMEDLRHRIANVRLEERGWAQELQRLAAAQRADAQAQRERFQEQARAVAGTAAKIGILKVATGALAGVLRREGTPALTKFVLRLKDLATEAVRGLNPVRKLADAWGNFIRTIRRIAFRFIIYKTLRQITQMAQGIVTALLETAPAFEEIQRGFYNLASAAGTTGKKLLAAMSEAAKGTIPMMELMRKASYAVLTYGRDITQYLPELIAGARRASKALGIDLAEAYNRIIDGLARSSKRMLSGVGIVFSSAAAYETYAAQIGKVAGDLTDAEKRAAYLQATLGFLRAQAKALGEETFTTRDAISAFRVSLKDLAVTSFQVFMPVLKRLFIGLNTIVQRLGPPFRAGVAGAAIVLDNLLTIVKGLVQAITRTRTFQILRDWAVGIGQTLGYFVNQMSVQMPRIIQNLDDLVQRLLGGERGFERLKDAAMTSLSVMRSVFQAILAAMTGDWDAFWYHLGEGAKTGLTFVLITVGNWAQTIFARFDEMTGGFLSWGANLVFYFAKGFIQGAGTFLVTALNFVGGVIKAFLGAFSPPKKGPLRDIVKWGLGLIESYFYGMTLASFDLFEQAIRPIEQRLQSLMDWGDIDETRFAEVMTHARELLAEYALELQQTGIVNEDVLGRLSELMQGAGDDVVRYIRVLGRLIQAQTAMDDVQEEYNKEAEKGFVTEAMATKMREARLRLRAAQKEERWDRAFVSQRQTGIDIWIRQEKLLKSMADTVTDLFEEMNFGISELDLNLGNALDSFKDMFAGFKLPALEFSEMFQEMRAEVNWFMRGLAGEVFPAGLPEGAPAAFVRGAELRKSLDTLRTSIGGLKETWAPLVEEVKKFFDQFTDEDIERLGEAAGWLVAFDAVTGPLRGKVADLVLKIADLGVKMLLLKTLLGLGAGSATGAGAAAGAAAGTGVVASLGWAAVGLGLIAGGVLWLASVLTDTTIAEQLELIGSYWKEKLPEAAEVFKQKVGGAVEWINTKTGELAGAVNEFAALLADPSKWPGTFLNAVIGAWDRLWGAISRARGAAGGGGVGGEAPTAAPSAPAYTPPTYMPMITKPYTPPRPRGLQEFQHGGFIPRTGLYGLHKDEFVLTSDLARGLTQFLARPQLPADMPAAAGGGGLIIQFMGDMHIRDETDLTMLAQKISWLIGQKADRMARLGA